MTEYLTLEDLLQRVTMMNATVRDLGLLEAAAARPHASAFGQDAYPDVPLKAAALMHSLVMNHAVVDGNKRLGLACALMMLHLNGYVSTASDDELFDLTMDTIQLGLNVPVIAERLKAEPVAAS